MSLKSTNRHILEQAGNFAQRFADNHTVRAINSGLINLIPIVLIGSVCIVLSNLPLPALHTVLNDLTMGNWTTVSQMITCGTEDIIALAAMISVSLSLANDSKFIQKREISGFIPVFTALACYVILFVWNQQSYQTATEFFSPELLLVNVGRRGVLWTLAIAVVATKLFIAFGELWQKIRGSRKPIVDITYQIRTALYALFPMAMTLLVFVVLRFFVDWLYEETQLEEAFYQFIAQVINDGSFGGVLLSVLAMQLLWFVGSQGSDVMQAFLSPESTLLYGGQANGDTLFAGQTTVLSNQTNTVLDTFTNPDFYQCFIDLGGAGATLAFVIALFVFGSNARGRRLARIGAFPSIFNINGPLLYGAPLVLNPFMLIPFVLTPVLIAAFCYAAFSLGLVPPITANTDWTTPIFFSGYLATGSFAGAALQALSLGLAFLVYAPFVLIVRWNTERNQSELYGQFKREASLAANSEQAVLLNRHDEIGAMARDFISEINEYFDKGRLPFHMVYQPKTNCRCDVAGAEALLRWTHPRFGPVPPDILIELTDEAGLTTEFARWITQESLEEFARWRGFGLSEVLLSINLNPRHLFIDPEFPDFLDAQLTRLAINRSLIELEITEHLAVGASEEMKQLFKRLRALGVGLSIDDMGLGYSSLTYISDFGAKTVKIDISLIDKIDGDFQQQEIVRSVVELANSLDLAIIVEGVEAYQQLEVLTELGCHYFQGYYFSRPLLPADFVDFVAQHGQTRLLTNREELEAVAAAAGGPQTEPPLCIG